MALLKRSSSTRKILGENPACMNTVLLLKHPALYQIRNPYPAWICELLAKKELPLIVLFVQIWESVIGY